TSCFVRSTPALRQIGRRHRPSDIAPAQDAAGASGLILVPGSDAIGRAPRRFRRAAGDVVQINSAGDAILSRMDAAERADVADTSDDNQRYSKSFTSFLFCRR
ncbi:MAG TPA: hypothetical protein VGC51_04380, partial [Hansschlegelia sp.]